MKEVIMAAAAIAAAKLLSSDCGMKMSGGGEPRIKRGQMSGSLIQSRSCIEEQGQQAYRRAERETLFRAQV